MPRRIYIVRHGERIDVADATWLPTAARPWDPPLTERGKQQAATTGAVLAKLPIHRIFSSPFLRCLETAHQIALQCARNGTEVIVNVEEGITEFMCKAWFERQPEYLHPEETVLACTHVNLYYQGMMRTFYPESINDMGSRYIRCIKNICSMLHDDEHVVIVTHGYGVQFMLEALDPTVTVVETPYCCLSSVVETDKPQAYRAQLITSVSHLKQE